LFALSLDLPKLFFQQLKKLVVVATPLCANADRFANAPIRANHWPP